MNRLVDLIYVIGCRVVQEALKMEDENGWKRLEKHLLTRIARAGLVDVDSSGLRDACECVLNCVYRIRLREGFEGYLPGHTWEWKGIKTM